MNLLDIIKSGRYLAVVDVESFGLFPKAYRGKGSERRRDNKLLKWLVPLAIERDPSVQKSTQYQTDKAAVDWLYAQPDFNQFEYIGCARIGVAIRSLDAPHYTHLGFYRRERVALAIEILRHAQFVSGFNIGYEQEHLDCRKWEGFDLAFLRHFYGAPLKLPPTTDIFLEIKAASGNAKWPNANEIMLYNLGFGKGGHGSGAPDLFKDGRDDEGDTYLAGDLIGELELAWKWYQNGYLISHKGKVVEWDLPPFVVRKHKAPYTNWQGDPEERDWENVEQFFPRDEDETRIDYYARIRPEICKHAIGPGFPTKGDLYGVVKNLREAKKNGVSP